MKALVASLLVLAAPAIAFVLATPMVALAEGGGGEHHGEWNYVGLAASVLNFVILLVILVWLGKDKVRDFLSGRREEIASSIESAQRIKAEAEKKHAEYTERLKQLDSELETLKSEMIKAGEAERDRIVADAEAKASRMRKEAEFLIEQQTKQLRADLLKEAVAAAAEQAEQMLTKATTPHDQQRLAQEYLNQLQKSANGASESHA